MISLAITTHNRSDLTIESFIKVLDNPIISEIVILDDYSNTDEFMKLWNLLYQLSPKIKFSRNSKNLKPLRNKFEAVKKCTNEWVILLDSDNIIDNDYVEVVSNIDKEPDMIYCPESLYTVGKTVVWCLFKEFDFIIDKGVAKKNIKDGMFQTLLNSGNYLVNRIQYVNMLKSAAKNSKLSVNDAMYFSYLWLLAGNRMRVVPGLAYVHRQHPGGIGGSWYANNVDGCLDATYDMIDKIKKWKN